MLRLGSLTDLRRMAASVPCRVRQGRGRFKSALASASNRNSGALWALANFKAALQGAAFLRLTAPFCTGMHANLVTSTLAHLNEEVHPPKADTVHTRGATLSASTLDSRFCPQVIVRQRLLADFPLSGRFHYSGGVGGGSKRINLAQRCMSPKLTAAVDDAIFTIDTALSIL
jgi:hypothetical protein